MAKPSDYYANDDVFRCGSDTRFEASRSNWGTVISLDSWDAPELSLRLTDEQRTALGRWLLDEDGA